jgi:histidinol-phosphate aminotransferase
LEGCAGELNRYPDGGAYRLRAALAERHGVRFEEVAIGSGADGLIDGISQAVLDEGDQIVCGWPSFPSYAIYARKLGAEPVQVPLRDHRYDLDALLAAITKRTKIVYICDPNNPTGTMSSRSELDAYFERVPDHVLTVLDQAYFEYVDEPATRTASRSTQAGRRVIVLHVRIWSCRRGGLRRRSGRARHCAWEDAAGFRPGAAQVAALASRIRPAFSSAGVRRMPKVVRTRTDPDRSGLQSDRTGRRQLCLR